MRDELADFFFTARDAEDYEDGSAAAYGPGSLADRLKYGPDAPAHKWPLLEEQKRLLAIVKRPGLGQPDRKAWVDARKPYWWKPARVRNKKRFDPFR